MYDHPGPDFLKDREHGSSVGNIWVVVRRGRQSILCSPKVKDRDLNGRLQLQQLRDNVMAEAATAASHDH